MTAAAKPAPKAIPAKMRQHWHQRATHLALFDCQLTELVSWDDSSLSRLQPQKHRALTDQLDQLVTNACGREMDIGKVSAKEREAWMAYILCLLAKDIWNCVKTLQPNLQKFGDY
jgi:hypothetical protein